MKIGIVTCHRSHNYGAVLQAYALKTFLSKQGHDVDFADIVPSYFNNDYKVPRKSFRKSTFKGKILYIKYILKWWWPSYRVINKRSKRFKSFISKYLIKESKDYNKQYFDLLIYGSDQIWSKEPLDNGTKYFDPIFWGNETLHANRKITYSASMGVLRILPEDHDFIKEHLKNFEKVAVREFDLYNYLIENKLISNSKISFTIDPVFLLDKEDWRKLVGKQIFKVPYLLFYDFQIDDITTKIVYEIAEKKNLKVIRITDGVVSVDENSGYMPSAGPLDFLSLIYYSDFVVSSSFHGTAFSIIFQKQFLVRQVWNTERVKTLLSRVGLSNRFISSNKLNENILSIDYDKVNIELSNIVSQSKEYLNSI
jgi:hypothetical protein